MQARYTHWAFGNMVIVGRRGRELVVFQRYYDLRWYRNRAFYPEIVR